MKNRLVRYTYFLKDKRIVYTGSRSTILELIHMGYTELMVIVCDRLTVFSNSGFEIISGNKWDGK